MDMLYVEIFAGMMRFLLLYLLQFGDADNAVCFNKHTQTNECCQDYKNISGNCEACIGMWGRDCVNNCSYGYYGHGCRNKCDCVFQLQICNPREGCVKNCNALLSEDCVNKTNCVSGYYGPSCGQQCNCTQFQLCDSVKGCINNSETGVITTSKNAQESDVTTRENEIITLIVIILLLFMAVLGKYSYLYILRNIRKHTTAAKCTLSEAENENTLQEEHRDSTYDNIRESGLIENSARHVSQSCNVSMHSCGDIDGLSKTSRFLQKQASKSKKYEKCLDGYDHYNHIDFKRGNTLPVKFDIFINYYDTLEPSDQTTREFNFENSVEMLGKIQTKRHPENIRHAQNNTSQKIQSTLPFRPYSSVKYNRNNSFG